VSQHRHAYVHGTYDSSLFHAYGALVIVGASIVLDKGTLLARMQTLHNVYHCVLAKFYYCCAGDTGYCGSHHEVAARVKDGQVYYY
jgi:hypothetical protein